LIAFLDPDLTCFVGDLSHEYHDGGVTASPRRNHMTRELKTKAQPAGVTKPRAAGVANASQVGGRISRVTAAVETKTLSTSSSAKRVARKKDAEVANPAQARKANAPRAESKAAQIIEMIGRTKGATLAELMKTTGWQAHSVRGYISTATRKQRIRIESAKNEEGDRLYKIAK
jgi:hypothetical protein